MKKFVLLTGIFAFTILASNTCMVFANENSLNTTEAQMIRNERIQRQNVFEKRLNLTDEQKVLAREIRVKGHEKLKPLVAQIRKDKQEIILIKNTRIAVQAQEEKIAPIEEDLKTLETEVEKIKKENMQEFEKILTRDQKKILKEMKKEGRHNYRCNHPMTPPAFTQTDKK